MPKLTRREFLKLSGQALAATGTACALGGLPCPRSAQAGTPIVLDGKEMVSRVGDTFATIHMVPRFSKSGAPETILGKVEYSTDPSFASSLESPTVAADDFRWSEGGRHRGLDGASQLVVSHKLCLRKYNWEIEPGDLIRNVSDGSVMTVSQIVNNTTIAGTLSGGTDNVWNQGDKWKLTRTYYRLEIKLTNLTPNTRYYYRVKLALGGEAWQSPRPVHSFHTRRAKGDTFKFAVWADAHRRQKLWPEWDAMLGSLQAEGVDFLVDVGDTWSLCNGHGEPHPAYMPPLYSVCRVTRSGRDGYRGVSDLCSDCAYYLARGNHEGISDYDPPKRHELLIELLKTVIPNPNGLTFPQGGSLDADYNQGYFAFEWGDALFAVVDVVKYKQNQRDFKSPDRFHIGQQQLDWLTSVLQGSAARWKLLFMHHTFGGGNDYGRGGATFAFEHEQAQVQALCEQYGAHIFYGHDHLLAQGWANGVLYYEAGSCGGLDRYDNKDYLYPEGHTSPCDGSGNCDYLGYLLVEVTPTVVTLQYKNYRGEVMHTMTLP